MKVKVISIPVQDQGKALAFYTNKLGFVKKVDVPLGEDRWLTVVYQKALFEAGIPYTQFNVDNTQKEYERLIKLGVEFSIKPTEMGTVKLAVFNDTCGNNIQIIEML